MTAGLDSHLKGFGVNGVVSSCRQRAFDGFLCILRRFQKRQVNSPAQSPKGSTGDRGYAPGVFLYDASPSSAEPGLKEQLLTIRLPSIRHAGARQKNRPAFSGPVLVFCNYRLKWAFSSSTVLRAHSPVTAPQRALRIGSFMPMLFSFMNFDTESAQFTDFATVFLAA